MKTGDERTIPESSDLMRSEFISTLTSNSKKNIVVIFIFRWAEKNIILDSLKFHMV